MEETNVSDVMKSIPDYFIAEKAIGMSATVQCNFTGSQGSDWVIEIEDQKCNVHEGIAVDPDLTIKANAVDGAKILNGQLDPKRAYLFGKVKIKGDLSLGLKLASFFDTNR